MSRENAGKLLFECTQHTAWFRGIIESETDKTYLTKMPGSRAANRVHKVNAHVLLPVGTDQKTAEQAYRSAVQSFNEHVRAAENALRDVLALQKQAAIEAIAKAVSP